MNKLLVVVSGFAVLALAGCGNKSYEYEGKYYVTLGEDCSESTNPRDNEKPLLEIMKKDSGGAPQYILRTPAVGRLGVPLTSPQSATPSDKGELAFTYTKTEPAGVFSSGTSVEVVFKLTPNRSKPGYIWLTNWDVTASGNGELKETNMLDQLRRGHDIGSSGLCLRKEADKS